MANFATGGATEARCPLCDRLIVRPKTREPRRFADFEFGVCQCTAVYVHDITGHNLGAAFMEALGFACGDDWDMAWGLMPGEDYEDALLEGYDIESNLVEPTGRTKEGKRVKGVLTFIRLKPDLRDVISRGRGSFGAIDDQTRGVQEKGDRIHGGFQTASARYSKGDVDNLVRDGRIEELSLAAVHDPLVIRKVQRLLYAADIRLRWNAVMALGAVIGRLADDRPSVAGNMVRTLLYACNDSAAANWGAIETLGEVIRLRPGVYGSFIRHLLGLLNDPPSRPAIFWAMGRIGGQHPKLVRSNAFFSIFNFLEDPDPNVRGHAAWALGRIKAAEAASAIERMVMDEETVDLFDGEMLIKTTVGRIAREALSNIYGINGGDKYMDEDAGKIKNGGDPVRSDEAVEL
ncbi:MAG: DVU0298 family protein, partial [Dissulfurimicrobium sp.]